MNGKLIFFDIDGTLWDYHNMIPESTKLAIKKLKENGHKTFINTGRSRGFVRNKELLNLGFDGIVSGCGTMIEMNGKTLFCHELAKNVVEDTLSRKSSGNLSYSYSIRIPLLLKLRALNVELAQGEKGSLLATLKIQLVLIDRVREAQDQDEQMVKIKE